MSKRKGTVRLCKINTELTQGDHSAIEIYCALSPALKVPVGGSLL